MTLTTMTIIELTRFASTADLSDDYAPNEADRLSERIGESQSGFP